jgi:hypothetical protein
MQKLIGGGLRGSASPKVVTVSSNEGVFSWVDEYGMEVSFKKALSFM